MENTNQNYKRAEADFEQNESYFRAKKKVDALKGFYRHLLIYLIINTFIVSTIVYTTNAEIFSLNTMSTPIFWGIGLFFHGLGVFGRDILFGKKWEERQIEAFMEKEKDY